MGYVNQIATRFAEDYAQARFERLAPAVAVRVPQIILEQRPWYNPGMDSLWFFVPLGPARFA